LDDPAERQAVLGDIEESGTAGGRELLDVMGLVFLRQLASWKSWRPWVVTASLILPLWGVVSPAFSIALYVSRQAGPSSSPTDLRGLSILFGMAVITLLMALAVGFTLGRLVRYCAVAVVPVLAFFTVLSFWDDIRDAIESGFPGVMLYGMSVLTFVVVPGILGLVRGLQGTALQPQSAVGFALLGALTFGFLVAVGGARITWGDCLALVLAWPALYALSTARVHLGAPDSEQA
jgi:hypothetical protein